MAVFKVIAELYKEPDDLRNLVHYVYHKSIDFTTYNLFPLDIDAVVNQMLYLQSRKDQVLHTRALHFVLSYDTAGWEWQMIQEKVSASITTVLGIAGILGMRDYQCCAGIHDVESHRHIHFIVNPVNITDLKILHYNKVEYMRFLKELAFALYMQYKIALVGVSYITEEGKMKYIKKGKDNSFLYENRRYSYEPL